MHQHPKTRLKKANKNNNLGGGRVHKDWEAGSMAYVIPGEQRNNENFRSKKKKNPVQRIKKPNAFTLLLLLVPN